MTETRATLQSSLTQPSNAIPPATVQVLTFRVSGEEYGVDILRVQEIRSWSAPTPVPNTPAYIKGVINIRGDVIVIADLRERLALPTGTQGSVVIVVLRVMSSGSERAMGVIVDAMSDVTNIPHSAIKAPPILGVAGVRPLVTGMVALENKLISILDVDQIFDGC